ncbi:HAD-IIIA family hydrolase [Massilia sp. TS11]|uniref:D-glycero-alpha-D-manno-heptose-1,7-bisphosphate 7-phosphatase n=1 Tax=Massilia sp. TS11 TaxID=2908003 RepID=UPI001EDA489D|nr:HAD-IIIA family hydrolase [Massilia sp. TS11]MCG2586864.1 HAD-IIIA family hydrolase [Massilia sp. TS11]
MRSAVFLDKDGTLVENLPFNTEPSRLVLAPGAVRGLRRLRRLGYRLLVVSNQSGLAHGRFDLRALARLWRHLSQTLAIQGAMLDGFYFCPHAVDGKVGAFAGSCSCRKPAPGLLLQAAADHDIDLASSWMVGDILDDVEAGHRAGCRSLLLDNGNETEWRRTALRLPDLIAPDLRTAMRVIPPPGVAP